MAVLEKMRGCSLLQDARDVDTIKKNVAKPKTEEKTSFALAFSLVLQERRH